jgi:transcriptional antiterminator
MDTETKLKPQASSIKDFAQRLGVCRRTIYNQINAGLLDTTKIGKRRVITERQELEYLDRCRA